MSKRIVVNPELFQLSGKKQSNSYSSLQSSKSVSSQSASNSNTTKLSNKTNIRNMSSRILKMLNENKKEQEMSSAIHKKNNNHDNAQVSSYENEVTEALNDMNKIAIKNTKRQTRKNKNKNTPKPSYDFEHFQSNDIIVDLKQFDEKVIDLDTPMYKLKPDPYYGCLKNGNKPTVSKTRKNIHFEKEPVQSVETFDSIDNLMRERRNKIQELQHQKTTRESEQVQFPKQPQETNLTSSNKACLNNLSTLSNSHTLSDNSNKQNQESENISIQIQPKSPVFDHPQLGIQNQKASNTLEMNTSGGSNKNRKTKKHKKITMDANIGKKNGKVNVLLDNRKTRRCVRNDLSKIQSISIDEIKSFLFKKSLIKRGCTTPEYILREMYKNAIMSGDIINTNKQNIVNEIIKMT